MVLVPQMYSRAPRETDLCEEVMNYPADEERTGNN